jgi:hypothetical protein
MTRLHQADEDGTLYILYQRKIVTENSGSGTFEKNPGGVCPGFLLQPFLPQFLITLGWLFMPNRGHGKSF